MRTHMLLATSMMISLAATQPLQAADIDREVGLIVSGVVDQWAGVQLIDDGLADDTVFASGGAGYLSLPLGSNLSVQTDAKYEYNERAFDTIRAPFGPRYSFSGATHLSWRDPGRGLFGVFGGVGISAWNTTREARFVGGEGQVYLGNFTLYGQGGYVDFAPDTGSFVDDGFFARGVVRWFLDNGSRLQLEGTYINADKLLNAGSVDGFSVGARYDFDLRDMPLAGDLPLYVAYRGTFRNDCVVALDVDDHTFMIGTSYSFSGDRLTIDRQGATLNTPDFAFDCRGIAN